MRALRPQEESANGDEAGMVFGGVVVCPPGANFRGVRMGGEPGGWAVPGPSFGDRLHIDEEISPNVPQNVPKDIPKDVP